MRPSGRNAAGRRTSRQARGQLRVTGDTTAARGRHWDAHAMSELTELPRRVQEAIRRQQDSSEILLCWTQLLVFLVLSLLYIAAPKTFSAEQTFAPVPFALAGYIGFTLLRLALAHARRLPRWLSYVSVVVDILVLLALMWSFHLQYEQPPSFYLKAPTLLYVFIFIALRALYFDFQFVVLAGMSAALGWLALVAYVVLVDPNDPMITRNYVEYMTSNSVLIGAEFDKVVSILMVTAILAVAIVRSRRLLIRAVHEGNTRDELARFVPSAVATRAATAASSLRAGDGEVREATIFFSDIEGFTGLSEQLSPTELITVLNEYFAEVTEPLVAHGAEINQYQGDAILASFNLPGPLEDHAAHAVQAALEIHEILAQRTFGKGVRLRSRIGINTGVVIGGLVGNQHRLGYTLHGDEVNLAARLETLNKTHGTTTIVSARTRELAGESLCRYRDLGETLVRGRSASVRIYAVEAL
jgi:adenylate cyclase